MVDEDAMGRYSMVGGMRGWGWLMMWVHAGHVQDIYRRRRRTKARLRGRRLLGQLGPGGGGESRMCGRTGDMSEHDRGGTRGAEKVARRIERAK